MHVNVVFCLTGWAYWGRRILSGKKVTVKFGQSNTKIHLFHKNIPNHVFWGVDRIKNEVFCFGNKPLGVSQPWPLIQS